MKFSWWLVALLWVAALLNYLDRQVIFSVFPLLQKEFHLDNIQLGLLGTVFLWVYGILSPVAGYIADRFGKRRTILFSLLVWSSVTWMTGHTHSFSQLLWTRGLMGISEAFFLPAALAWIAEHHRDHTRALATGLFMSGNYVGIVIGGVGGGWMGDHFGFRFAFIMLGIVGIGYTAVLWLLTRGQSIAESSVQEAPLLNCLRDVFRLRGFLFLTGIFAAVSTANWVAYAWLPLHLYERRHMTLADAGFTATFYVQVGAFAGILLGGVIADRWIIRSPRGRLWTQALALTVAAPFLFVVGGVSSWPLLLVSLIVFGIGRGTFDSNAMPILCQIAPPSLRATGYGIFNCAGCIAGGLMTVAAGWIKAHAGLSGAFQFAAVMWLLSACMLAMLRLRRVMFESAK
jgi:MFS transporter, Spinster family, sphingosine-1-phosphate transporter